MLLAMPRHFSLDSLDLDPWVIQLRHKTIRSIALFSPALADVPTSTAIVEHADGAAVRRKITYSSFGILSPSNGWDNEEDILVFIETEN